MKDNHQNNQSFLCKGHCYASYPINRFMVFFQVLRKNINKLSVVCILCIIFKKPYGHIIKPFLNQSMFKIQPIYKFLLLSFFHYVAVSGVVFWFIFVWGRGCFWTWQSLVHAEAKKSSFPLDCFLYNLYVVPKCLTLPATCYKNLSFDLTDGKDILTHEAHPPPERSDSPDTISPTHPQSDRV